MNIINIYTACHLGKNHLNTLILNEVKWSQQLDGAVSECTSRVKWGYANLPDIVNYGFG